MKVARYNPKDRESEYPMYKSNSGKWVTYSDYVKLQQRVQELEDTLETRVLIEMSMEQT